LKNHYRSDRLVVVADMSKRRGRLIAIEGIDQAGKRTQTNLLAAKIRATGRPISVWNFPDYNTPLGRQLKAYLRRRVHLDLHAVHLLYAANKWEVVERLKDEIEAGRVVIVNRYTPSNIAYGLAHGLGREWLLTLEEGLPKPDLVFVLDVSPRISQLRKRRARDVHESDLRYLTKVRKWYRKLAYAYGWKIIDGRRDEEQISRLIFDMAKTVSWTRLVPTSGCNR